MRRANADTTFLAIIMTGVFIILLVTVLQADWENLQDESLKAYGMPLSQLGRLGMHARIANSTLSALAGEQLMEAFRDAWLQGPFTCPKHDGRWSYTDKTCADPSAFTGRVLREAEERMRSLRQDEYLLLNPTYTYDGGRTIFTADLILTGKSGQELRGTPLALLVHTPIRVTLTTPYLQAAEDFLRKVGEEGLPGDARRDAYDAALRSTQVMAELRGLLQEESGGEECTRAILRPGAYTLAWLRKEDETFFALRMGDETVFWHQQTPVLIQDTLLGGGDACDSLIRKLREKTGVTRAEGGCLEGEQVAIISLPREDGGGSWVKLSSRHDPPASCRLRERTLRVTEGDFHTPPGEVHLVTITQPEDEETVEPLILTPSGSGVPLARVAYAVETSLERMPRIITLNTPADARTLPPSLPDTLKDAIEAFYTEYWDVKPVVILIPLGVTSDFQNAYARLQQLLAEPISEGRQPGMPITIPPDALPEDYPLPKLPAGLLQPGVKDPFWLIPLPVAFSMPVRARWPLDTVNKISQCAGRVPVEAQEELRYITHTGIDLVPRDQSQREGSGADAFFPPPGGLVHASLPGEVLAWSTLIPRGDRYQRVTFLNTRLLKRLEEEYGLTKKKLPFWALPYMGKTAGEIKEENVEGVFFSSRDGWLDDETGERTWSGMLGETVLVYTPSLHLISVYGHLAPLSSLEQHAVWRDPLSKEARAEGMLPLRVLKRFCAACSFVREDEAGREAYYPLRVALGDPLGLVGNTGNSQAPHLHFELWDVRSLAQRESRSVTPAVRNPFCLLPEEAVRCADSACTRTVKVSRVSLYPTAGGGLPVDFSSEDAARLFEHAQPGSFAAVCLADELVAQGMHPPGGEWVPPCP